MEMQRLMLSRNSVLYIQRTIKPFPLRLVYPPHYADARVPTSTRPPGAAARSAVWAHTLTGPGGASAPLRTWGAWGGGRSTGCTWCRAPRSRWTAPCRWCPLMWEWRQVTCVTIWQQEVRLHEGFVCTVDKNNTTKAVTFRSPECVEYRLWNRKKWSRRQ